MVFQTIMKSSSSFNMLKLNFEELKSIYDNPTVFVETYFKNLKLEIENAMNGLMNSKRKDELKTKLKEMLTKLTQLESECANSYFKIKPVKERIEQIENKLVLVTEKSDYLNDLISQEKHNLKAMLFSNRTILFLNKNKCQNKFLFTERIPFKLIVIKNEYLNSSVVENLKNRNDSLVKKLTSEEIKIRSLEISIHLTKSHISEISSEASDRTKFYINGTEAAKIEDNSFQKLKNLKELNLSANKLEKITQNAFNGLNSLEFLHLSENLINSIEANSFRCFTNLKELNLNGCLLTTIRVNLFHDLVNLQTLNLSNNKISVIEINSFQKLSNLQDLFLSRNFLTDLPKKLFLGLINLKMLNLADNKLSSIDSSAFKGVTKLKMLFLNRNPVSSEFQYIFVRNKFKSNFRKSNPDCKVLIEDIV